MVEDPAHLGAREVGVDFESGALSNVFGMAFAAQPVAIVGRPPVLPHDGVVDGLAGGTVPHNRGFPLVCDADPGDVRHRQSGLGHGIPSGGELRSQDFLWIVLHPSRLGIVLGEFLLGQGDNVSGMIKNQTAAAGRALVEGEDVLAHSGFHLMLQPSEGICPSSGIACPASNRSKTRRMSAPVTGMSLPGLAPSNCPR